MLVPDMNVRGTINLIPVKFYTMNSTIGMLPSDRNALDFYCKWTVFPRQLQLSTPR